MGVLDDAIREHLELKRKHGAAEEELRRQEEEALGPARREMAQAPEQPAPSSGDGTVDEEDDLEPEAALPEAGEQEEAVLDSGAPPFDAEEHEHAEPEPEARLHAAEEPGAMTDEPEEPELEDEEPLNVAEEAELEDRYAELDREPEDEDSGDVLEDTPDFLQETPEHDRLWFEQKPPRDFDFD